MTERQPDFVIIGATRSATTWLQRNLQQHAVVFMPGTETHYFSWHFERGPAWYRTFFTPAAAHQIVGEKSTSYLDHPEAAQRLRAALPDIRLIMQLRNPIERVWAHYCMDSRSSEGGADAERHLRAGPDAERLRAGGLYFRHVSRFFELFPRDQLCVTLYDDLDREPTGVLDRVRAHVGLATAAGAEAIAPAEPPEAGEARPKPPGGLVKPLGDSARRRTRSTRSRSGRYPELSDTIRQGLRSYYEDDVRALSQLLDRDLSSWLAPTRAIG